MGDHIFISYSRKDKAIVDRIVAILQRSNIAVWRDHEQIQPGTPDWEQAIRQGITTARGVIYAASEDAAKSEYVRDELQVARDNKIRIYPLWMAGTRWSDCIPLGYGRIQYEDGRSDLEAGLQAVIVQFDITSSQQAQISAHLDTSRIFEDMEAFKRRLPIYLLLDCSDSMLGDPIAGINKGLRDMYYGLTHSSMSRFMWISVITFGGKAVQYPLAPVHEFQVPLLKAGGNRVMGDALRLLADSIEHDLVHDPSRLMGDYRPVVFLMTDGNPVDYIDTYVSRIKSLPDNLEPVIAVIALGSNPKIETLRRITNKVLMGQDLTADTMADFFKLRD